LGRPHRVFLGLIQCRGRAATGWDARAGRSTIWPMNEGPRFTLCVVCCATLLVSEVEWHVCRVRGSASMAACPVEQRMPAHIHQNGAPERPADLRVQQYVITTSTAPPPSVYRLG